MAGIGRPNEHVFFFFDDQPLGDVVIGSDGTWTFEVEQKLGEGEHAIRADTYDAKTGVVEGRASLRLGREPKTEGVATPHKRRLRLNRRQRPRRKLPPQSPGLPRRDRPQANQSRSILTGRRRRWLAGAVHVRRCRGAAGSVVAASAGLSGRRGGVGGSSG
jgi:hypothetical protein